MTQDDRRHQGRNGQGLQGGPARRRPGYAEQELPPELRVEPVPAAVLSLLGRVENSRRHPGLLLDKFLKPCPNQEQQKDAISRVCGSGRFERELREEWLPKRRSILECCSAVAWTRITQGPLTLHLARASSLENAGICLHPVYGFTFLPGTGLKGMARSFARTVWLPVQKDETEAGRMVEEVFGRAAHRAGETSASGTVVFHDAWPTSWPRLTADIVNNHHKAYYQGDGAPVDWDDPNPVYLFCVEPGQEFSFAVSPRRRDIPQKHLDLARAWLNGALSHLGAGAKTTSGYGYFAHPPGESADSGLTTARAEVSATVELVTPAFLAGADPQAEDGCGLRPATLKGLLRWWWRTLYAGFLDKKQMLALEGAIWGDTVASGAVQVAVIPATVGRPQLFDYKQGFKPKADFARAHCLEPPPQKSTAGVFYLSYGMDEKKGGVRIQRHYLEAGSSWTIRLIARDTKFDPDREVLKNPRASTAKISRGEVLEQAKASLWLLCRFGGVGAKSRKGFGSLHIAGPEVWSSMSMDSVREAAHRLLLGIGLPAEFKTAIAHSSALNNMLGPVEKPTAWTDAWYAMDQVGLAYQTFTKQYKHDEAKLALGLPRKIHGPNRDSHQPPEELSKRIGKSRFASPVHIHLSKEAGEKLTVRVVAFPSPHLPNYQQSKQVLGQFLETLDSELAKRASSKGKPPDVGRVGVPPSARFPDIRNKHGLPAPGNVVEAVLLEERTKKGGWRAIHEPTGFEGPIVNTGEVPADKKAGDVVSLTVGSVNQNKKMMDFRWKKE